MAIEQHIGAEWLAEENRRKEARIAELEALYDKAFSGSGGLLHRKELVRMLDERDAQLAELREAAGELVANAEWDGDISTVDTDDLKALRAPLLQEPPHD